ncbi:MAG TPA: FtsX-like permease family protein [Polyangiaceae bacterium]|jgi:putative ABC transport system permease protein|nr:FtsX-like permease family protein [Polyangiaceae bacterium]
MTIGGIGIRNVWRNKTRTTLTVLGGAVAVLAFILLRTVLWAWNVGVEYSAKDRLATRHKVSLIMPLPKRYVDDIRQIPGIKQTTWANWFGGKDPRRPDEFFSTLAVDPESFFQVYPEMAVPPVDMARWKEDRRGAIVGDVLARKLGVKVGDKVTLAGTIFPGDWEFNVDGIYEATQKSVDKSQLLFHWAYLNESMPERRKDLVGWVISRIDNPSQSANLTMAVDKLFDEKDVQTTTMSERSMNNSFMAAFSAILTALNIVSVIILLIMMLILGNTIAMGVRERTREYGVLRALGFSPKHVATFVIGEALTIGVLAGVLGCALSYPVVQLGMGRWLEENMGAFFPYFRVSIETALVAALLSVLLGAVSAIIPAMQASKLTIIDALRRVG